MPASAPEPASPCSDCGAPIPRNAPQGLCPRCLVRQCLGSLVRPGPPVASLLTGRFFGDYELLTEVGRGGSAVVFKARQFGLNRVVALKLLASGPVASRDFIHRFHTEASAAARLEHPHIVPIYEFGEHEGNHFLAMRYCEGGTLRERIAHSRPSPEEAARLLIAIASAVDFAHRHGILHRDLKPANILLDAEGKPFVSDFGLARVLAEDSSLTLTHSILGTVAYLSPEIAAAGAASATTASDIYGLGCILYELLAERPPFLKSTLAATLRAIGDENPVRPREGNAAVPLDLETICLKCLEKDPGKRYRSAQFLAEDLQRFLNNEPISARPITRRARLMCWSRRNPALALAYAVALLLFIIILAASPLIAYQFSRARNAESIARYRAEQNAYSSDMLLTQLALDDNRIGEARTLLERYKPRPSRSSLLSTSLEHDLRGWEWHYYLEQTKGNELRILGKHATSIVTAVGFLPDGDRAWSAGRDGTVRIWHVPTGQQVQLLPQDGPVVDAASSPDGRWLVTICGSGLAPAAHPMRLWDLATGGVDSVLSTNRFPRKVTKFSPDSRLLAYEEVGDGIHLFDLVTRGETALLPGFRSKIAPLGFDFSSSAPMLAYCGSPNGEIHLWNYVARTNVGLLVGHTNVVQTLCFFPDGQRLVSAALDGTLRVWDIAERKELLKVQLPKIDVWPVIVSPQGDLLAFIDETEQVKVLDAATGKLHHELRGMQGSVNAVAFSLDGQTIMASGGDEAVRLWPRDPAPPRGNRIKPLPPGLLLTANRSELFSLSSAGNHLITIFTNATFGVLDTRTLTDVTRCDLPGTNVLQEAISPDGRRAALATLNKGGVSLFLWDIQSNKATWTVQLGEPISAGRMAFSRDGTRLAFPAWPNLRLYEVKSGREIGTFDFRDTYNYDIAGGTTFSRDGQRLAIANYSGWMLAWDLAEGALLAKNRVAETILTSAVFSRDGSTVFTGGNGLRSLQVHRLKNGVAPSALDSGLGGVIATAISDDGKTLAVAESQDIALWSVESWHRVGRLRGHRHEVRALAFRDDGALVSASYDELGVWSSASGAP